MKKNVTAYSAVLPTWDKMDCSVRALACVTGCTYEAASAAHSAAGRRLKKPTDFETARKVYEEWLRMKEVPAKMRLAEFIAMYPIGRFVLHKSGHAFALVDGVVFDWEGTSKPTTQVIWAWEANGETLARMKKVEMLLV